jgi:hypothetical protein
MRRGKGEDVKIGMVIFFGILREEAILRCHDDVAL